MPQNNKNNNNKQPKKGRRPSDKRRTPQGGPRTPGRFYKAPRATYGSLGVIAQTIAIPRDHRPVRLPTFPNLERTAVLAFTDTSTDKMDLAKSDGSAESDYLLTRDPFMPLWASTKVKGRRMFQHRYPATQKLLPNHTFDVAIPASARWNGTDDLASDSPTFRHLQHGDHIYTFFGGIVDVNTAPTLILYVDTTTAATNNATLLVSYSISTINGKGEVMNTISNSLHPLSPQLNGGRYMFTMGVGLPYDTVAARVYNLQLHGPDPVLNPDKHFDVSELIVGFSLGTVAGDPFNGTLGYVTRLWPRSPPAEMTNSMLFEAVRATATACLFTNVTSVMNKEGTASAARVCTKDFPAFDTTRWEGFQSVNPKERYFGALEKGLYAFTLPDSSSETFRDGTLWADHGVVINGQQFYNRLNVPIVHIEHLAYATCIRLSDPSDATPTSLALTLDRHIEFRTTSRIFATGYSTYQLEAYHTAQMALARLGTITENPTHMATLAIAVARALRAVAPIVTPYAVGAAQAVAQRGIDYAQNRLNNWRQKSMR